MVLLRPMLCLLLAILVGGCVEAKEEAKAERKGDGKGIIHKTTQEIGKFDPSDKQWVVGDQRINATDPITASLSTYGPTVEGIAKTSIKLALETFNATEGRYPKDYDEFMERIIKAKGAEIHLPVLPYNGRYQYDEANHALVIVRTEEDARKSGQVIPAAGSQPAAGEPAAEGQPAEGQTSEKAN
jgi:hypothetical protein